MHVLFFPKVLLAFGYKYKTDGIPPEEVSSIPAAIFDFNSTYQDLVQVFVGDISELGAVELGDHEL